ncbi:uncharacterized protein [Linepithema humile]|uniref:uncharacterized protein n=1 Tax=Linepithema humile TaxID=83485 RepID=UPI0006236852|nr:PREDICTED: uncharacterized protein LOC105679178 [Linepithema humile]
MSRVINILMSGTAITAAVIVGYKVIKSTIKKNFRSDKQTSEKAKIKKWCNADKKYPTLQSSNWRKIGQVVDLAIFPVKSSNISLNSDSFEFRDYGMCRQNFGTYIWDGMFAVYNETKGKFEDSRRYPLLRSLCTQLTNPGEVTFSSDRLSEVVTLNINRDRNPFNQIVMKTWNGTLKTFYGSDLHVNTWLKNWIDDDDETNEDVTLAQMQPRNGSWTERIKDNWFRFVQGYEAMEEDETGKFITLPRFVLMTSKTRLEIDGKVKHVAPNIIVDTDDESINPFIEKTWDWIKIGDDVILRKVKPVPSADERIQHKGIYCALWSGGNVKMNDEAYIYYSDI